MDLWPLLQFPKITDGSQWLHVDAKLQKGSWVVVEKVHGSNFCISSDGTATRCAKRTCWLEGDDDDESYFSLGDVVTRHAPRVIALCARLREIVPGAGPGSIVWVYGELCGGFYAGSGGSRDDAIQKEIQYCPHIEWLVFDVAFSASGRLQDAQFLRYTQLLEHCKAVELPALAPLFTGPMNKCMNYDPVFATTVPALFRLPALVGNNAEGVVVRCDEAAKGQSPLFEATLRDAKDRVVRAVAKHKAPQFAEVLARFSR